MVNASSQQGGTGRVELPTSAVWVRRLVWFMLVGGQVAFAVVVCMVLANGGGAGHRLPAVVTVSVGGAIAAVGMVLAVLSRRGIVAVDDPVALRRAASRNLIVPMAVLEAASTFGLAVLLVTGDPWPIAAVPAVALLVQLWLFPKRTVRRR